MGNLRSWVSVAKVGALALVATAAFAGPWFARGGHGLSGGGHGRFGGGRVYGGRVYGGSFRALPGGYATFRFGGSPYYYAGGLWYRPWRGAYIGCYPPIGLGLAVLPLGYATYWWGGVPYYCYEDVYYTAAVGGGYQVVEPPPEAPPVGQSQPQTPPPASRPDPNLDALLIVPQEGQSEERMQADRRDAQRFAQQKSGYDPANINPEDPGTPRARQAYRRALRNYLEQRGYSVK